MGRHNHDKAHTVHSESRQRIDVGAQDMVITPLEAEMLRILVDTAKGPAALKELTNAPSVRGKMDLH
ncbi:MAG: hypothetical protein ABSD38_07940 [Syntrophorhabdales bacterium]